MMKLRTKIKAALNVFAKVWGMKSALVVLVGIGLVSATMGAAQSFSCSIGQPACLGWGETVCSSSGKCVSDSAMCFDRWQCDFEGFTCKSNVSECVDKYESLLAKYNELVADYNKVLRSRADLASDYDDLYEATQSLAEVIENIEFCVNWADTLEDAKTCLSQ